MKTTTGAKAAQPGYASMSASNPSILLDKLNARRSTPDSEALASSDDEQDTNRQDVQPSAAPSQKPTRRASWLNDTTQPLGQPRKGSFASSTMSPTASHPTTPSAESGTWGSHLQSVSTSAIGRGPSASTSFPWGSGIWNSDSRKEPPSRLTEVLPSPTSASGATNGLGMFPSESTTIKSPSVAREAGPEPPIPFAIPIHPTPKNYRSQSYSVGQLDPDTSAIGSGPAATSAFTGRARAAPHSVLQHRPSRPSMLSEVSNDGIGLEKLKEVEDDDDESASGTRPITQIQEAPAKTLEMLTRENAILRQQNYQSSLRLRPRSSTTNATTNSFASVGQYGIHDSVAEESEYAIDELDEINELQDITNRGPLARRLSEYGSSQVPRASAFAAENRKIENVKKAYWQSSLGFGGIPELPQSRRHSFADVPARQGSVSSVGEPLSVHEDYNPENIMPAEHLNRYQGVGNYQMNDHLASYFGGIPHQPRLPEAYLPSAYPASVYHSYAMNAPYAVGRPSSPHRAMYGVPQPRHNQLLYIVLFKCSRADVFYVQEGTGLTVKPGDLVIVEADRGTDLGTVAQENVDWQTAKELKEHYAEEHYKWLMMYSQGAAATSDGTGAGLMAASNGLQGSAVGGMGPISQHGMQEPNPSELKPKIIKRLAQPHEIQALRDKEGNEAKAKRVCMQKVKEHGLHMEILDAEFQMDWKKLTFYYFADAYINFNSLVTDLFKVYKTRIWMSAINAASFASPSLGLQAPSGIGPGAVGVSRSTHSDRRQQQPEQSAYNGLAQTNRPYSGSHPGGFVGQPDRTPVQQGGFPQPGFTYGYQTFAAAPRGVSAAAAAYAPSMVPPIDGFPSFASQGGYAGMPVRFPSPHGLGLGPDGADYARQGNGHSPAADGWMNSFQSLSLNSR